MKWQPFLALAVFFVACKSTEMIAEIDFGFAPKLAPLVVALAFFGFLLRENPFKINTELVLER